MISKPVSHKLRRWQARNLICGVLFNVIQFYAGFSFEKWKILHLTLYIIKIEGISTIVKCWRVIFRFIWSWEISTIVWSWWEISTIIWSWWEISTIVKFDGKFPQFSSVGGKFPLRILDVDWKLLSKPAVGLFWKNFNQNFPIRQYWVCEL